MKGKLHRIFTRTTIFFTIETNKGANVNYVSTLVGESIKWLK